MHLVAVLAGHVDRGNVERNGVECGALAQVLCELRHHFLDIRSILDVVGLAQVEPDFAVRGAAVTLKGL